MVTLNPVKRKQEIEERRDNRHEEVPADARYHAVEVLSWRQVEREVNYWAQHGWRLHTLRDGLRSSGPADEIGYRLLLERI